MEYTQIFDLIIIGGGPGGYHAANVAAKAGLSVALFEENSLGGVCLSEGCIPSKAILKSAKIFQCASHAREYGVNVEAFTIDQKSVVARKNSVVSKLVMGVRGNLRKNKVKLFFSHADIVNCNEGFCVLSQEKYYRSTSLIIATGSKVFIPNIEGLNDWFKSGKAVTSKQILNLECIPDELVVVGGGIIGIEMACYFASCNSKVTVIEFTDKICGNCDSEASAVLLDNLQKIGIEFKLNSRVVQFTNDGIVYEQKGEKSLLNCSLCLISTGRKPNTDGFNLQALSPKTTKNGAIECDERMQTSIDNLYAIGDVNGKSMLAHTAYREAEVCVNNIINKRDLMDYTCIPSAVYSTPEAAWVGESEQSATEKGLDFTVKKLPMTYSGRFVAENTQASGICKVLIDNQSGIIIGGAIVSDYASEIITVLSNVVALKLTVEQVNKLVLPHPTVCEIINDVINV